MKLRALSTVLVAAVAMTGLSACDSKVGQAAVVGGHRISDSDLNPYVSRTGPSAQVLANQQPGQEIFPRAEALNTLVRQALLEHVLVKTGGLPSDNIVAGYHDQVAQAAFNSSATGDAFDKQLTGQVTQYGLTASFAQLLITVDELQYALAQRVKPTSPDDLLAAIAKYPVPVSVAGRYGKWSPSKFTLDSSAGAGLPGFISFDSTTS